MNNITSKSEGGEELEKILFTQSALPEALLRDLTKTYDRINLMSLKEVTDKLKCFHLSTKGSEIDLRETLKNSYKEIILAGKDLSVSSILLPYYVVVDFEATCEEIQKPNYRHEIIEFPAVLINSKKQKIIDCFQMYCKPQINPKLSKFCTELTGITQKQVDSAETFDEVLKHFKKWLVKHNLGVKYKFGVVADGPSDICRYLYSQCYYSKVLLPGWAKSWVNLKKTFSNFYKCKRLCLKEMLEYLDLEFIGKLHCGLDDAKNIARILLKMIYDGANIQINERLTYSANEDKLNFKNNHSGIVENQEAELEADKTDPPFRKQANYTAVYCTELTYKRTKRKRLIAEVKLARQILMNTDSSENSIKKSGIRKTQNSLKTGSNFLMRK